MTPLDKLTQQIDNIIKKQRLLIEENKRLKQEISTFNKNRDAIKNWKKEKEHYEQQERKIKELTEKIDKILHAVA